MYQLMGLGSGNNETVSSYHEFTVAASGNSGNLLFNYSKKQRYPVYNQNDRMKIINGLRYVNLCFEEESLDLKRHYIELYKADVLVMGDDWKGKFDEYSDICEVVYLDRTPSVSTTQLIEVISSSDQ